MQLQNLGGHVGAGEPVPFLSTVLLCVINIPMQCTVLLGVINIPMECTVLLFVVIIPMEWHVLLCVIAICVFLFVVYLQCILKWI